MIRVPVGDDADDGFVREFCEESGQRVRYAEAAVYESGLLRADHEIEHDPVGIVGMVLLHDAVQAASQILFVIYFKHFHILR